MLASEAQAGHEVHLLCYAHGEGEPPLGVQVHRAPTLLRDRSLRSGPSLTKAVADAGLALALSRLRRQLRPERLVAHHVEAALAASGPGRFVFFAHTDLGAELPSYAPAPLRAGLARAGRGVDTLLLRRAPAVAAVSPLLARRLQRGRPASAPAVRHVPIPWSAPSSAPESSTARSELDLPHDAPLLLYAGNLDGYQGWRALTLALSRLRTREAMLLVATESDARALRDHAEQLGVGERLRVVGLKGEAQRARVHAAADLVLVPRATPGGLPIKLLDAMARGRACVAMRMAAAELPIDDAVAVCDDDAGSMAETVDRLLGNDTKRVALANAAERYVRDEHAAERYLEAMQRVVTGS
jgi:glycosyltransferase involved in cell wall biosynthesis